MRESELSVHRSFCVVQRCSSSRPLAARGRIMKYVRWIAVCVVVALALGTTALGASAQSSSSEKPKATDIGITDKEIHVAVIADVDSPLAPNLFKAAVDGMKGWAKYTNSKAGRRRSRRPQGRDRLLRLEAQPGGDEERADHRVPERCCRGGHLGGVPDVGRRDAQLQGLDRRGHRPARHSVRVDGAGAAMLRPVVPDCAAAGAL